VVSGEPGEGPHSSGPFLLRGGDMKTKDNTNFLLFVIVIVVMWLGYVTSMVIDTDSKLARRVDRVEADNVLQQQMIKKLGQDALTDR
jgi:hypothetical protein